MKVSVGENVAYGLREHFFKKMSETEMADRVAWALGLVGLPGIEDMRPADLSGGMKKRVGLARAIAVQPEVLLYDEPTTGLDPINTARINHLIMGLKKALNVTSIVVTHDMKSAFEISDRMAMVFRGEIIQQGTPDEFTNSKDPRVSDFINGHAPVNEDVATHGAGGGGGAATGQRRREQRRRDCQFDDGRGDDRPRGGVTRAPPAGVNPRAQPCPRAHPNRRPGRARRPAAHRRTLRRRGSR